MAMKQLDDGTVVARAKSIPDVVPLRLNDDWKRWLVQDKEILEQTKDSTLLKQLAYIGHIAIHDPLIGAILGSVLDNRRKNERAGVIDFE